MSALSEPSVLALVLLAFALGVVVVAPLGYLCCVFFPPPQVGPRTRSTTADGDDAKRSLDRITSATRDAGGVR